MTTTAFPTKHLVWVDPVTFYVARDLDVKSIELCPDGAKVEKLLARVVRLSGELSVPSGEKLAVGVRGRPVALDVVRPDGTSYRRNRQFADAEAYLKGLKRIAQACHAWKAPAPTSPRGVEVMKFREGEIAYVLTRRDFPSSAQAFKFYRAEAWTGQLDMPVIQRGRLRDRHRGSFAVKLAGEVDDVIWADREMVSVSVEDAIQRLRDHQVTWWGYAE
jgi:hypothetical protein